MTKDASRFTKSSRLPASWNVFYVLIVLLLIFSLPITATAADTYLGECEEISSGALNEVNTPCTGGVYQDAQGSYYIAQRGRPKIKPQKGNDIAYAEKDSQDRKVVIQPVENIDETTNKVHQLKDAYFDALAQVPAEPGDLIYPLLLPEELILEYLALDPPAFGVGSFSSVAFFGIDLQPSRILVLGSKTEDLLSPTAFLLEVGTEGLAIDYSARDIPIMSIISTGAYTPSTSSNEVILVAIPEPATLALVAAALACLGCARTSMRARAARRAAAGGGAAGRRALSK